MVEHVVMLHSNDRGGGISPEGGHAAEATKVNILSSAMYDSWGLHGNDHRFVRKRTMERFVAQVGQPTFTVHTTQGNIMWS